MKSVYLILGLVTISLSGCATQTTPKTISTPQSLQSLSIATNTTTATETNTSTITNPTTEENESQQNESTQETEKIFTTQQDFVDYMYEKVQALEETVSLLDSNLTQVYSVAGTESETAQLSIRDNLLAQTTNEMNTIESLQRPTENVATLQDYVVKAYYYNIQYKTEEYQVFKAETLEERQVLLDANAENERLAQQYISLAWSEIDRLSETTYYRK